MSWLWLYLRISTAPSTTSARGVTSALVIATCAPGVTGVLLLLVSVLFLALLLGAPGWWVPLLCPGSPGLWALPLWQGEGEIWDKPGLWFPLPLLAFSCSRVAGVMGATVAVGTMIVGPDATAAQLLVAVGAAAA